MKLNSKFFDSIRVSSRRQQGAKKDARATSCQWKGCDKPGSHKAPKGRGRDGEYFHFCMDHVRQYNHEYNYFDGMSDAEVDDFRKDALTGHRPTWKSGANAWAHGTRDGARTAEAAERVAASTQKMTRRARSSRTEAPDVPPAIEAARAKIVAHARSGRKGNARGHQVAVQGTREDSSSGRKRRR